ncbi:glucose 1-dehydrogenase [Alicyclobacillus fastidiosus]|uniref:Glucose 1-dehydrogenase n=1 Tax=Alicyclobacillus fastidiosus TaxID=392011 RepID=A0ABY6ZAV1_9BACL|nr:glucose 1-dehydrogenase [Alicyclobacillus fastidiosus]WAH39962.1 glucose 1-dehydrogenase [Alicyclobacillus fastidiosus]GMA61242.1 short-chain dehydrogenase [Alicyclobacillus fastidiosus]
MRRLDQRVAVVTGSGSGIGRAAAIMFAKEGAKVVVVDLDLPAAQETVRRIADEGGQAIAIRCDVSDAQDVKTSVERVVEHYGRLDILFNNAGIVLPKYIEEVEEAEWDHLFDINVKGCFLFIKYSLAHIRATKGTILNMGSMTGLAGQRRNPVYSATKGAVAALTRSLAIDLAPDGVRVNSICPAGVLTPLLEKWFAQQANPDEFRRGQDLSHLLGRTATPDEIASVAVFLASDEASFITGQSIPVEGGATIGYGVGPKAEWHEN